MKRNYKLVTGFVALLGLTTLELGAQCISPQGQYPSGTINVANNIAGNTTGISGCQYSEYAVVNFAQPGAYQITNNIATDWVTVANNAAGTIIYGTGQCPYTISINTAGTYYLHFSASGAPNCSWTSGFCKITGITNIGPLCNAAPVTPTIAATAGTICPGTGTSFTANSEPFGGYVYQWYSSPNISGPFIAVSNATNSTYSPQNLSTTTAFQLVKSCPASPNSATSAAVPVIVGAPPAVTVLPSQTLICPNGGVNLSLPYPYSGVLYSWESSTISALGLFTPVPNATLSTLAANNVTATTYYRAIVSCSSNPTASVATNPTVAMVQGLTVSNVPYFEGFENIAVGGNQLPNCSWLSPGTSFQTYTLAQPANRNPFQGSKFASFYDANATNYVYTNGINLVAGVTYSTSMRYQTESYGYTNWNLSLMLGTSQAAAGLVNIATVSPAVAASYKTIAGTFTVATSGVYYLAIKAASNINYGYYMSVDNLLIDIPCSLNSPTLTATGPSSVCLGSNVGITASGADTYSWSTGSTSNGISTIPNILGTNNYVVTGTKTLSACSATLTKAVTVLAGPIISAFTTDPNNAVCPGSSAVLYAVGSANTYTWSTFGVAGANTTVMPTASTTYTVRGTNSTNCVTEQTITVNVKDAPQVGGNAAHSTICLGEAATLVGTGAVTYTWTAGNGTYLTGSTVTPMPTAPTNYNVYGTDANGCVGTALVAQNVDKCVGIQNISASNSNITVFPNPTTGEFTVELSTNTVKDIQVTDLTGRVLFTNSTTDGTVKFNINNLASGIYYVKVKSADAVEVVKIVKQ